MSDRYDALIGLADALADAADPAALFSALHDRLEAVLPTESFVGARVEGKEIQPVVSEGVALGCEAFCVGALDRLAAGRAALGVRVEGGGFFIAAPLVREGRLLGCIAAGRTGDASYDAADAAFLEAVGRFAGAALDSALASREVRRQRDAYEWLDAAVRDLGLPLDLDEVADRVAAQAQALVDRPVVVWLVDGAHARAIARAGGALVRSGDTRALPPVVAARLLAGVGGWRDEPAAAADGVAVVSLASGNGSPDPAAGSTDPRPRAGASRTSIPFVLGQRLIGFLAIGPWSGEPPDPDRLRRLTRLAPHAAAAIENARLRAQVNRLALTDPLLGLPNPRQFDLFLEREFAAAVRGRGLCLVLMHLDPRDGRAGNAAEHAGDAALIRFADLLRAETRAMNIAARYGGEKFAVILSGGDLSGGRTYAERLRRRLRRESEGRSTVSAGIAEYRREMTSPADLLAAADLALARARLNGGDRVDIAAE